MAYDDQNVFDDPALMPAQTGGLGGLGGWFNGLNTKNLGTAQALITAGAPTTKPQNNMLQMAQLMQGDTKSAQLKARLKAMGLTDEQIALALASGQGGSGGGLLTGLFNKPSGA